MEQIQLGERNYQSLYNILRAYKKSGTSRDDIAGDFNRFDTPANFYFRIFFDFSKGLLNAVDSVSNNQPATSNLSGVTINDPFKQGMPDFNTIWKKDRKPLSGSAINYLLLNNEWERADMLRDFINLLSNINTNSPWYFSEISGLGDLMERTEFADTFTIPEVKPITIKCLPDAYDNRIGTLLDLYRSICYSWQLHKEIVPANLRRFDMYIYIFNTPIRGIHAIHGTGDEDWNIDTLGDKANTLDYVRSKDGPPAVGSPASTPKYHFGETKEPVDGKWATFDHDAAPMNLEFGSHSSPRQYLTSSKLIHLMDCEIDMNANKSGYSELKNDEGFSQVYEIPIKVNSYMEQRYNEFLMKFMGDIVAGDFDLPNSSQESPGTLRKTFYSESIASKTRKIKYKNEDNRLDQKNLKQGIVTPYEGEPLTVDEVEPARKGTTNRLNKKISGKDSESLLDPWLNIGKKKLKDVEGQVNKIIKAGQSAINSWTDIYRLNRSLASGVNHIVNRVTWGNLFEINLQEITRNLSSDVAGFTSDNIFDTVASGWTHNTIDRQDNPENSVGGSLFDNPDNPSVPPHEFNPDSIQH